MSKIQRGIVLNQAIMQEIGETILGNAEAFKEIADLKDKYEKELALHGLALDIGRKECATLKDKLSRRNMQIKDLKTRVDIVEGQLKEVVVNYQEAVKFERFVKANNKFMASYTIYGNR
jgi:hypothetical protein